VGAKANVNGVIEGAVIAPDIKTNVPATKFS
jgi:hypothetical protein